MTAEKARLGKRLFFDKLLSVDGSVSCASCHAPEKDFSDSEQFSSGVGGRRGTRHAPTIINRVFSAAQFWDGRAESLEAQIFSPVQNPMEMAMPDMQVVVDRLRKDPRYLAEFDAAFPSGSGVTARNVVCAIAVFERTIVSGNSPYDRFIAGAATALNESARRGMVVFMDERKGNCRTCHAGLNFTDESYNNIGVGMTGEHPDMGRYNVTRLEGHQGAFKTPTLRDVARRGPYMHDGSQKSLEEVVDFYDQGGHPNKWLSPKIKPLHLSPQEKLDLVEFLKGLNGELTWYGMVDEQ